MAEIGAPQASLLQREGKLTDNVQSFQERSDSNHGAGEMTD